MTTDVAIPETELDLEHLSPLICMELAAGLSTPEGVRKKYEISENQWLRLRENPTFVAMMKEATLAFAGDMNAGKRITKKAEVLLEESLPILHRLMVSPAASSGTIIDVVKQLTVLAEKGPKNTGKDGAGIGPGFNVQIEIHSNDAKGVVIQGN
jgi:hypothetical protein